MSSCGRDEDPFAWIRSVRPVTPFPEKSTVLVLPGAGKAQMDQRRLKGELWVPPCYQVRVPYEAIPLPSFAATGVANLNSLLLSTGGKIVVYGHSMGAQIIYKWLREFGPTSEVDPSRVTLISSGNPERKYGGASVNAASAHPATYGGVGFPANTRYKVIDFVRQYDYFADHPNDLLNDYAMRNVGSFFFDNNVHSEYNNVSLTDGRNLRFQEGNCTYIWSPTYPLWLANVRSWKLFPAIHRKMEAKYRPLVEAGYSRPVKIPLAI